MNRQEPIVKGFTQTMDSKVPRCYFLLKLYGAAGQKSPSRRGFKLYQR